MKKDRLKIGYFLPTTGFGGTELHTFSLITYLISQGYDVTLIFPVSSETSRVISWCNDNSIAYIDCDFAYPGGRQNKTVVGDIQLQLLSKTIGETRFDFAYVAAPSPIVLFGILGYLKQRDIPTICIFHLVHPSSTFSKKERDFFKLSYFRRLKYVAVGVFTKDVMVDVLGIPKDLIKVINNGVQIDKALSTNYTLRKQLGLREDEKIVYTFGRLHQQKSMDVLLEAIPEVLVSEPNTHFVWAGEGELDTSLRSRAKALGVWS